MAEYLTVKVARTKWENALFTCEEARKLGEEELSKRFRDFINSPWEGNFLCQLKRMSRINGDQLPLFEEIPV